jgi:hypothetical protein
VPSAPSEQPPAPAPDGDSGNRQTASSLDVVAFSRQAESARAAGCRCMLKWDGTSATPLFMAEARQLRCPVHFVED